MSSPQSLLRYLFLAGTVRQDLVYPAVISTFQLYSFKYRDCTTHDSRDRMGFDVVNLIA